MTARTCFIVRKLGVVSTEFIFLLCTFFTVSDDSFPTQHSPVGICKGYYVSGLLWVETQFLSTIFGTENSRFNFHVHSKSYVF